MVKTWSLMIHFLIFKQNRGGGQPFLTRLVSIARVHVYNSRVHDSRVHVYNYGNRMKGHHGIGTQI